MFAKEFLLKKNYELQARIGEGTYATVYKARRLSDSESVAVKIINVFKMNRKKIENALNEVRIICAIDHPNVVGYHEAFLDEHNKDLYIVMEYVGGGDLNDRIRLLKQSKSFLPEKLLWKYAIQIMQGLKALHDRKIIHRDIKPGNIFVSEDLLTLKIGDLNVSKIMRNRAMTATVIGTPYYLAPEIWKNAMYDYRCDVFSFGCVLYEVSALRVPFQGNSIAELFKKIEYSKVPNLPKQYSTGYFDFILLCLTRNMRQRPTVEKLLRSPAVVRRKMMCKDVVFDDRHTPKKALEHMRVKDLSRLKQILPGLKSMRSNSVKMLGGAHFSNPKLHSARDFHNFSCLQNSQLSDSTSTKSAYKSRLKFISDQSKPTESQKHKIRKQSKSKAKRRKRNSLSGVNSSKRKSLEAKKNYVRFLKEQRKRKSIQAKLETKERWKAGLRQETIEEEGELVGTLEMDREPPIFLGQAEAVKIEGIHTNRKKLTRPPDKKKSASRRPPPEDTTKADNVFTSQVSVKTHKTDKKEMNVECTNMREEVINKRTRERDSRTSSKLKAPGSKMVSRSASRIKKHAQEAEPIYLKKKMKVKRVSVQHKRKNQLANQAGTNMSGKLKVRTKAKGKQNYRSTQVEPRKSKRGLCSERKIIQSNTQNKKNQKQVPGTTGLRKKKKERKGSAKKGNKKGRQANRNWESSRGANREKRNQAHFKRVTNKKQNHKKPVEKGQKNFPKTIKDKKEMKEQILETNKIKLKPLKNLDEMGVFSSSKKIGKSVLDVRRPPARRAQTEYESSELSSLQSHQSRLRLDESRGAQKNLPKKSTVLPIASHANKFKKKCLKIPNRTVISAYSNQSHIQRKIDSTKRKMKTRFKPKLYLPVANKKRSKVPKKVKSHLECPSESEQLDLAKPSRTMTSIVVQWNPAQSDCSDLESPREFRSPSAQKPKKKLRVGTTPNSKVNNLFLKESPRTGDFLENNPLVFDSKKILKYLKTKNKKTKPVRANKKLKKTKTIKQENRIKIDKTKRGKKSKKDSEKRANKIKAKNFRTGVLKMNQNSSKFDSKKVVSSQRFI